MGGGRRRTGRRVKNRAPQKLAKKNSGRVDPLLCLHSRDTTATFSWKCPFFQGVGRWSAPFPRPATRHLRRPSRAECRLQEATHWRIADREVERHENLRKLAKLIPLPMHPVPA